MKVLLKKKGIVQPFSGSIVCEEVGWVGVSESTLPIKVF